MGTRWSFGSVRQGFGVVNPDRLSSEILVTKLFRRGLTMDVLKLVLGLFIPATGAAFVWLLSIARKDPALFHEIDRVLVSWTSDVLFMVVSMGVVNFFMYDDKNSRILLVMMVSVLVYLLLKLRSSLPFFRRVAQLGDQAPQKARTDI